MRSACPASTPVRAPSAADQVFERALRAGGDAGAAAGRAALRGGGGAAAGVSRQPVRDAFWRLSQLGFLTIRPQRSTDGQRRSPSEAVLQARFVRTALEIETVRVAAERLRRGGARRRSTRCSRRRRRRWRRTTASGSTRSTTSSTGGSATLAGHEFAWALIRENKAHMDRVRFLSLELRRAGGARRPRRDPRGDARRRRRGARSRRCGRISGGSRTSWRGFG